MRSNLNFGNGISYGIYIMSREFKSGNLIGSVAHRTEDGVNRFSRGKLGGDFDFIIRTILKED